MVKDIFCSVYNLYYDRLIVSFMFCLSFTWNLHPLLIYQIILDYIASTNSCYTILQMRAYNLREILQTILQQFHTIELKSFYWFSSILILPSFLLHTNNNLLDNCDDFFFFFLVLLDLLQMDFFSKAFKILHSKSYSSIIYVLK